MRIKDVSYKEFFELAEQEREDYTFALLYSVPQPRSLKTPSFQALPFGFVKDVQASQPLSFESFLELLQELEGAEVANYSIFALYAEMLYFISEIESINEAEKMLARAPTGEELAAGSEGITNFGALPQFLELAGGDPTKIEAVKALKYSVAFACLLYNEEMFEYRQRLEAIRRTK